MSRNDNWRLWKRTTRSDRSLGPSSDVRRIDLVTGEVIDIIKARKPAKPKFKAKKNMGRLEPIKADSVFWKCWREDRDLMISSGYRVKHTSKAWLVSRWTNAGAGEKGQ